MTTLIRRATDSDLDALVALNAEVQALHADAIPWRFKRPGAGGFSRVDAAALLAGADNLVFIAQTDSVPAGYAYAEIARRAETPLHFAYSMIYLHHIAVRAERRGEGVGGLLVDAVRSESRKLGIDIVAADVWTFNTAASAFFHSQGFETYNERLWRRA